MKPDKERHIFLREWTERWYFGFEALCLVVIVSAAVFYVVMSDAPLWTAVWDALKSILLGTSVG